MKTILCSVTCCLIVHLGVAQFQHSFGTEKSEIGRSITQLQKVEKGYLIGGYTAENFIGNQDATLIKTDLNGSQLWSYVYGGTSYEYFNSVRQSTYFSPNNKTSYVAAGITNSYGSGSGDAFLVGVDTNGSPVFSAVYGRNGYDIAHCVQNIKDQNGKPGYIMAGTTRSYPSAYPGTNLYVVQTDLLGNLTRATVIGGSGNQQGMWIEQTKDGGYIIAGSTTNYWCGNPTVNPATDIFVVKLRSNLTMEWNRILGYPTLPPTSSYKNVATCVKQNRQGNYILTGYTNGFGLNNSYDPFLLHMDPTGNFLGMKTYGTERTELGYSLEETISNSGNQYYTIVGQQVIGSRKAMLFQTDAGGNLLWARDYGRNGNETGLELTTDDFDKGFAFTGYTTSIGAGGTDIYLVETTATGKTGSSCEKEIKLKEVKHEPCITRSAQQIFVKDYKKIQPIVRKVGYKEDRCGLKFGAKFEEDNTLKNGTDITLYPNPVREQLTITLGASKAVTQLEIFNIQGIMIFQNDQLNQSEKTVIPVTTLKSGIYLIKLATDRGKIHLMKFLKE